MRDITILYTIGYIRHTKHTEIYNVLYTHGYMIMHIGQFLYHGPKAAVGSHHAIAPSMQPSSSILYSI